ncbi:MAG: hypothetical protein EBU90_12505 [Proteobacteria bacterium]|jgi:hypothetical protein|nr:hypothetical protein [Pseudomonadota bacterium]NBP15167.1 hypothetical protein [bacterium]
MQFNFDPTNIDLVARPGEAFLKSAGFLMTGMMFEGLNINEMHIPPIILEFAKLCAYLGAGVAFFKFVINLFKKDKDKEE